MGQFSTEIYIPPGSTLSGNQQRCILEWVITPVDEMTQNLLQNTSSMNYKTLIIKVKILKGQIPTPPLHPPRYFSLLSGRMCKMRECGR